MCIASTARSAPNRRTPISALLSVWDRIFGSYATIARSQHDAIVFGVRELPRRECLKATAMMLTPWRLARTSPPTRLERGRAAGGR